MFISIDIGGTNSRIALFDSLRQPKILDLISFENKNDYDADIHDITTAVHKLTKDKIEGIGICVPAVLNTDKTLITVCSNLGNWVNKPIKSDLSNQFKCAVALDNDAVAAALGEAHFGYGKGKDFLLIIWGTGIGGTAVRFYDNKYLLDAFEPGHHPRDWNGAKCPCGQKGCFDFFIGGAGIQRHFNRPADRLGEKEWSEVINDFSHCLLNIIMIRPTNLIVLSGGVAVKQSKRIKQITDILKERLAVYDVPDIKISKLREEIELYGALSLLKDLIK